MLTVVTSGKAAPGVTTSCWALALSWPRRLLVVDCDPAGGDMAAGWLVGRIGAGPYPADEVAAALEIRLGGRLPADRQAAAALSDGAPTAFTVLQRSPLLKSAGTLASTLVTDREPLAFQSLGSR